ncbi:DUF4224 domain-containing protein [Paraburkholderia silviterrae]|uniref:DUF4224 domain-containing protein n=1 Tax=Paraburkholderia silviterrae TaxID=2528715 RepID=A0A4R5ME09_9BURK|nr:DUF4224 domain-containing protein [Paraburkholderia silviterrae]TDG25332.1 DUF4224 domain-containing protein [Paraburkholderia silviterrae]
MATYMTRAELAELVGCEPRSLACMRRWLDRNNWPYVTNLAGVPQVIRQYFIDRMSGRAAPAANTEDEPDFSALDA